MDLGSKNVEQVITEAMSTDCVALSGFFTYWKKLVSQEEQFKTQLAELSNQLTDRDTERHRLLYKMEELQRDVSVKSAGMERLQAELASATKESDCVRRRMHRLEDDLNEFKQKNSELAEELLKKAGELQSSEGADEERSAQMEASVKDLQGKMQLLETQLTEIRKERDELQKEREDMLAEREEEMRIVQEALEEAQEEKLSIQAQFEQDFEKLRTVNTDREQQLLDDFEWKLREVEQACKRRLEEKDKAAEERVRQLRKDLEAEGQAKTEQDQASQLSQLKSYEAEVSQLRGLTHEQQRSLRNSARQTEQLQVSERMLKEEIARLQSSLDKEKAHYSAMQTIHDRRMAEFEKKLQSRLDQQKSELTAFWEDRMKKECARLKMELDQIHMEEKKLAMESVRAQKEQDMQAVKKEWDHKLQAYVKEISSLKKQASEKDSHYQGELQRLQTNADRDILELRRKLDKLDMSYQEQIEQMVEKHEKEMQQLSEESERRVQQLEQNWQLQMTSTRTTLELVKEQMERDAQDRMEAAEERHRTQLAQQWDQLMEQKELALEEEAKRQNVLVDEMKEQLDAAVTSHKARESELLEKISSLQQQLEGQSTEIGELQGSVDLLEGGMQVLNQQITSQGQELVRTQQQAAYKLNDAASLQDNESGKLTALSVFLLPFLSWVLSGSFSLTLSSMLVACAVVLYRGL